MKRCEYDVLLSARHAPHELSFSCILLDCIHSATSLTSDAIRSTQYVGTARERIVFRHRMEFKYRIIGRFSDV